VAALRSAIAVVAAASWTLAPAHARTLDNERAEQFGFKVESFRCPIGDEAFRQAVTHPHFPLTTWPDGSHPGDEWIEMQLPECPGNRLVILPDYSIEADDTGRLTYRTFSDEELVRLQELIHSDGYKALFGEVRQLRGYWLATQLDLPLLDRMQLITHAVWAAGDDVQRRHALEAFVRDGPGLIDAYTTDEEQRAGARIRIANALRELGRFAEALDVLDAIEASGFEFDTPVGPDALFSEGPYLPKMRAVINAGNSDRAPIALLESGMASRVCGDPAQFLPVPGKNTLADCQARRAAREREFGSPQADAEQAANEAADALTALSPDGPPR
jgi:hypothetical protein